MKPTIRYLALRGEVYQLRLSVPSDIQDRMGRKELRWSLQTKQKRLAEYRTWKAAVLFDDLCDSIRGMPDVDQSHVKALVLEFFEELKASFKSPPAMSVTTKDHYIIEQAAMAEQAILEWQKQLHSNDFDEEVRFEANRFLKARGLEYSALAAEQRFRLLNGMTRAKVEYQKFVAQMLGDPFVEYVPSDQLFAGEVAEVSGNEVPVQAKAQHSGPELQLVTVGELAEQFIERGEKTGYGRRHPLEARNPKALPKSVALVCRICGCGHRYKVSQQKPC
ncbi:MAG: DUF6538 domain-containing protein [Pseudomonadota bacterium]